MSGLIVGLIADLLCLFKFPEILTAAQDRKIRSSLGYCGKNVHIRHPTVIEVPENVRIEDDVTIGSFVHIWGNAGVTIGRGTMIASHVAITSTTHDPDASVMKETQIDQPVTIQHDVWIGAHAVIFPNVTIGAHAVIAAGAVVLVDVPANAIVAGVPAKLVRQKTEFNHRINDPARLQPPSSRGYAGWIKNLMGEKLRGAIGLARHGRRNPGWFSPFNSQSARTDLFHQIVDYAQPSAIVEIGAEKGATTKLMALTNLPVFSIEADSYEYGAARLQVLGTDNVRLFNGENGAVLAKLFDGDLGKYLKQPVFFYFKTHQRPDLVHTAELELIFRKCPSAVVMIDDFEVPHDAGYAFNDYGKEGALRASSIATVLACHHAKLLYPATPSVDEVGSRRGCVVLCIGSQMERALSECSLLRAGEYQSER